MGRHLYFRDDFCRIWSLDQATGTVNGSLDTSGGELFEAGAPELAPRILYSPEKGKLALLATAGGMLQQGTRLVMRGTVREPSIPDYWTVCHGPGFKQLPALDPADNEVRFGEAGDTATDESGRYQLELIGRGKIPIEVLGEFHNCIALGGQAQPATLNTVQPIPTVLDIVAGTRPGRLE